MTRTGSRYYLPKNSKPLKSSSDSINRPPTREEEEQIRKEDVNAAINKTPARKRRCSSCGRGRRLRR